jgi:lysophospholipase L1-like esterase
MCFVGDSFVAGVGDPEHRGWVGRIAARGSAAGLRLTAYNLGVRRETSGEVLARWAAECAQRLPAEADCRVVVSFGVNDTTDENGARRVPLALSGANLATLLDGASAAAWPALVVGPPPVADGAQNERTALVDEAFARICAGRGVPYVPIISRLLDSPRWMAEVAVGDGAHPGAPGYEELADLVWPHWSGWAGSPARPAGTPPRH